MNDYKKRIGLGNRTTQRPHDSARAPKCQPERAANYGRRYLHICALIQIQKSIRTGVLAENWHVENGLVTRDHSGGNEEGPDVLEVRQVDGVDFWFVTALDEALVYPDPRFFIAVHFKFNFYLFIVSYYPDCRSTRRRSCQTASSGNI